VRRDQYYTSNFRNIPLGAAWNSRIWLVEIIQCAMKNLSVKGSTEELISQGKYGTLFVDTMEETVYFDSVWDADFAVSIN
jgi:hypothetical protein